jgi:hypothetical protein
MPGVWDCWYEFEASTVVSKLSGVWGLRHELAKMRGGVMGNMIRRSEICITSGCNVT